MSFDIISRRRSRRAPSDLGDRNTHALETLASQYRDTRYVDLGVRFGYSSEALLKGSEGRRVFVHGFDIDGSRLPDHLRLNPRYEFSSADSVTAGLMWNPARSVSILFIDTIHVKEMVLAELLAWFPHLAPGATIVLHDTHWAPEKFEDFAGRKWERPEAAVLEFFGLAELCDFENEDLAITCLPESNGMTFVRVREPSSFSNGVHDWETVLKRHREVLEHFSTEEELEWLGVKLPVAPA